jgi:hypothetical protein
MKAGHSNPLGTYRLRTIDGPRTIRVTALGPERDAWTSRKGRALVLEQIDGDDLDLRRWRECDLDSPNVERLD